MEHTFREKLYRSTKKEHKAVEGVFDFENGIASDNLDLFLRTMLTARTICAPYLLTLSESCGINTGNEMLLNALRKDLGEFDDDTIAPKELWNCPPMDNVNTQIGVFYVFAGSSMGARVILARANETGIDFPLNYLETLVLMSSEQMSLLKTLLGQKDIVGDEIIAAARHTFELIKNIALNGLRKRITEF